MAGTYIQGLLVKRKNTVYLTSDLVVGKQDMIPTPAAGGRLDGDYWADPISDFGIVTGFNFSPRELGDTTPPEDKPQAFPVFRLVDEHGNDTWYVYGQSSDTAGSGSPAVYGYVQAAADAECCDATPRLLPDSFDGVIVPCYAMCDWDADGKYFAVLALPTLASGQRYLPYGLFNGTVLTGMTASGYTTASSLLTALNAHWGSVGTWTLVLDSQSPANTFAVKVTQTAGPGTDALCASVLAHTP